MYKTFPEYHFHFTQQASKINVIFLKDKINICMENIDTQDGVKKIVQRYITGRARIYRILFIYFLQFSFYFGTTPFPLPSFFVFIFYYSFIFGHAGFLLWLAGFL